jgi:hypothetical protein
MPVPYAMYYAILCCLLLTTWRTEFAIKSYSTQLGQQALIRISKVLHDLIVPFLLLLP